MHISRAVFKISDIVNHPLRNYIRYEGVRRVSDVPYGEGKFRRMDFYYSPSAAEKASGGRLPVLLNVHGGGFVCGGKKYRSGFARLFASKGYFVVNADYTLAPKGRFPTGGNDVIMAWNTLELFRERFPLDPDKIIITGDSAGGYWAAAAAAAAFSEEYRLGLGLEETPTAKPLALLTFCAPFNLFKCTEVPTPLGISEDIGDCLFGKAAEAEKYPKELIDITLNVNPDWCPVGMMAAEKDMFAGKQHEDMAAALKNAGVPYSVYVAREKGDMHCTHLYPFKKGSALTINAAERFLNAVVSGQDPVSESE